MHHGADRNIRGRIQREVCIMKKNEKIQKIAKTKKKIAKKKNKTTKRYLHTCLCHVQGSENK